jgi:hypothetical protein
MFKLRFDQEEIVKWANRYPIESDSKVEKIIAPQVHALRLYTKTQFITICHWKTSRSKHLIESNEEDYIKELTQIALSTLDERLRIEVLTLLTGVSWPTASVLLHFGHTDMYPILDFRSLWSLGMEKPPEQYNFSFWWEYTLFCRQVAKKKIK